jgi:glycosyltransferase involved in cell wall biosynthesis
VSVSRPTVSVVLPTLDEREHITDCLESLLSQDYDDILEIIVVDGGSTDGTRELAAARRVRVVDNPRVSAAAAMNEGIAAARGDVICRADAHTLYETDYVRRCVEVLRDTGAANVGGRMRPVGTTSFGRAVAAVTTSRFGVGPGRFHYAEERAEVDTVYLGCWLRSTLEKVGGYDEDNLQWAAEDQELNLRLRDAGGVIVLDPEIRSWYFPRSSARALARQYRNYGLAKASTLRKHGRFPSWRPLAPAVLVGATVAVGVCSRHRAGWIAVPALHAAACAAAAWKLSDDPGVAPQRAFAALEICHWSYGVGLWAGLWRIVRGCPFDRHAQEGRG